MTDKSTICNRCGYAPKHCTCMAAYPKFDNQENFVTAELPTGGLPGVTIDTGTPSPTHHLLELNRKAEDLDTVTTTFNDFEQIAGRINELFDGLHLSDPNLERHMLKAFNTIIGIWQVQLEDRIADLEGRPNVA